MKMEETPRAWDKQLMVNNNLKRANILIVDEFRLVSLNVINTVLKRFLTAPRQPGYLNNPEYADKQERNKEIYMSSAWLFLEI